MKLILDSKTKNKNFYNEALKKHQIKHEKDMQDKINKLKEELMIEDDK